jgi:hypothetical protein
MANQINTNTLTGGISRTPFNYAKVEQIGRDVSTAWLNLNQLSAQLNLYSDESQDTFLQSLELAVRQHIEDYLGMPIFGITYRVYYNLNSIQTNPAGLDLPQLSQNSNSTLASVTINSVGYYNSNVPATIVLLDSSTYQYDPTGNQVIVQSLPSAVNTNFANPVIVQYTLVPNVLATYPVIQQAGLLLFTHLYNNRSETVTTNLKSIPYGFDVLLRSYKPLVM